MFHSLLVSLWLCFTLTLVTVQVDAAKPGDFIPVPCNGEYTSTLSFCDVQLSREKRVSQVLDSLTLEEKALLLTARQSPSNTIPRLGISEFNWGGNCVHGVQSRCGSHCPTQFALPVALGATFNRTLVRRTFEWMGLELRALWIENVGENHASNLPHFGLSCWSPSINIGRDPRWGRMYEVPSEDPLWSGIYGTLYTLGLQNGSDDLPIHDRRYMTAVATLKHFDAYSLDNYEGVTRQDFNAIVSEYMFADTYYPAFQIAVSQGRAKGVMCSHNEINGVPACADKALLTDTLRNQWGFEGYVVSDSKAIQEIMTTQHYTDTVAEAVTLATQAGCDMDSCRGLDKCESSFSGVYSTNSPYTNLIPDLVNNGTLDESVVDQSVRNILNLYFDLGLFDAQDSRPNSGFDQPYWNVPPTMINAPDTRKLNLEGALQSMTLLKNEDDSVLPFLPPTSSNDELQTLAVIGPHYNASVDMLAGDNGQFCQEYGDESCIPGVLTELTKYWTQNGYGKVMYAQGCDVDCQNKRGFEQALSVASNADAIVLMFGINTSIEGENDDRVNITLPGYQSDLISEICQSTNTRIVLVLINGGVLGIDGLRDKCPSILEAWYPGFRGAEAIAMTVTGQNNPGGKLAVTMYYSNFVEQSSMLEMDLTVSPGKTYKYFQNEVIYPFGYGLSYTLFDITRVTDGSECDNGNDKVCVQIQNIGSVMGSETVFVFVSASIDAANSNATRISSRLVDFAKVQLSPKETALWQFTLNEDFALLSFDNDGNAMVYSGNYTLSFNNGNQGSSHYSGFDITLNVPNTRSLNYNPYLSDDFTYWMEPDISYS